MAGTDKVPEMRFIGFADAWEQRKVKDACSISTGKSNTQDRIENGIYPFYVRSPIIERSNRYLYDEEAVLTVGDGVGTGKVFHYVTGKYDLHQRVYRMFDFNGGVSAKYFYYYFSTHFYDRVMAMTAKTSVDSVRYEMISEMDIEFPCEAEQKAINKTFESLDNLITFHQRKYDKLVIVKKSMLEKMFPQDSANVPEIRFAGFTDAWEQRKVGDVTIELEQYTTLKSGYSLLTSSRTGLMFQNEYRDSLSTNNENTLFSIVPYGKCTYRHMSDDDIFHFNINHIVENGLVSREYPVFDASSNHCLPFIVEYLNSSCRFTAFCKEQKKGGTRTRLYFNNLCEFTLFMPCYEEQLKIATYLSELDNLINLYQRKLEKLKNIKNALLEKMFV